MFLLLVHSIIITAAEDKVNEYKRIAVEQKKISDLIKA